MATEIIVRVVPGGMMAANAIESEKLEQFKGREMMVKISIPRNLAFHKKFMALIGTAYSMADTKLGQEQFRKLCTINAGYSEQIHDGSGEVFTIPDSISFANMSDDRFERLYQDVLTYVCKTWVEDETQLNQIVEFM
jgi:hypothetical protein